MLLYIFLINIYIYYILLGGEAEKPNNESISHNEVISGLLKNINNAGGEWKVELKHVCSHTHRLSKSFVQLWVIEPFSICRIALQRLFLTTFRQWDSGIVGYNCTRKWYNFVKFQFQNECVTYQLIVCLHLFMWVQVSERNQENHHQLYYSIIK